VQRWAYNLKVMIYAVRVIVSSADSSALAQVNTSTGCQYVGIYSIRSHHSIPVSHSSRYPFAIPCSEVASYGSNR